jgi:dCMP deaminase
METAFRLSKKSHCVSKKVGAVLVKDSRIISMGFNGSFSGWKNCDNVFDQNNFNSDEHHHWSNVNEIHAEMNCILFAAKQGIETDGCTLYCTLSPCQHCLKNCIQAGISKIIFLVDYDRVEMDPGVLAFMKSKGIKIYQLDGSDMFYSKRRCISSYDDTIHYDEKLQDSLWYHTSWMSNNVINFDDEYAQRLYHIKNNLLEIPKKDSVFLKWVDGKYC